jgi:phenylacetate-CoA ligase
MASNLLLFSELDRETLPSDHRVSPVAIFVSGENLFDNVRRRLEQWFQCPVYSAYTSTEGGLIAIECRYHTGLHIQECRAQVEILDSSGTLSTEGTGEIVLTNFMNWAMPFVRYRTGDHADIRRVSCACGFVGPTIVEIYGREAVYFTISSRRIDPRILDTDLAQLPLKEYMVIQEGAGQFRVKWTSDITDINQDEVERLIANIIHNRLGEVRLQIQRVELLTSPGQKVNRYICIVG